MLSSLGKNGRSGKMLIKIFGAWLVLDGFFSMIVVYEKRLTYQMVRAIRIVIGICLIWV